jgi:predicted ATPase
MAAAVPSQSSLIPVMVLTGFLGSGKTTVLNRLRPNTVHFTIWMAVAKSVRVIGCGARGRSG